MRTTLSSDFLLPTVVNTVGLLTPARCDLVYSGRLVPLLQEQLAGGGEDGGLCLGGLPAPQGEEYCRYAALTSGTTDHPSRYSLDAQ
jgi:hypothetical protein